MRMAHTMLRHSPAPRLRRGPRRAGPLPGGGTDELFKVETVSAAAA